MNEHVTVTDVLQARQPLVMITAYDQLSARIVDAAEADMILVGDSLGMVIQGHTNTLQVTLDEVIYHAKAVTRTKPKAMVIGDLPYLSYHVSRAETVRNAGRLVQEAGVDAVKLEGGRNRLTMVSSLIDAEIPVMGHLGLTPQSVNAFGGFKVQGKTKEAGKVIMEDALRLQDAGIFALVLECVPSELAQEITQSLDIPTIGIGAGQMNRRDSSRIAAVKAAEAAETYGWAEPRTVGSAVASDAFFPFADGLLAAAEAGATAIIQPGGSIRDDEVIAAANEKGLAMVFTGMRHFRH